MGADSRQNLLDNDLSGDVAVDESAWTVDDSTLTVELSKLPDYSNSGSTSRPPWWPCAVRGGRKGPDDPNAPAKVQPNVQRLDAKIGEQVESKKSFQGKSQFQW